MNKYWIIMKEDSKLKKIQKVYKQALAMQVAIMIALVAAKPVKIIII